jgi:hypothetical protein
MIVPESADFDDGRDTFPERTMVWKLVEASKATLMEASNPAGAGGVCGVCGD